MICLVRLAAQKGRYFDPFLIRVGLFLRHLSRRLSTLLDLRLLAWRLLSGAICLACHPIDQGVDTKSRLVRVISRRCSFRARCLLRNRFCGGSAQACHGLG